jgi:hypothetical protein
MELATYQSQKLAKYMWSKLSILAKRT